MFDKLSHRVYLHNEYGISIGIRAGTLPIVFKNLSAILGCVNMDVHRESIAKLVLLDNSNYSYWKVRMMAYLKSIDIRAWISVVNGYKPPTKIVDEIEMPKPLEEYDRNELNKKI